MPTTGAITTTGEGHFVLPGWVQLTDLIVNVTAFNPRTQIYGSIAPFGLTRVGEYGLGSFPDDAGGSNPPVVYWSTFVRHDYEDIFPFLYSVGPVPFGVPSFFWRWLSGVTATIQASW